jgi:hypothetical protein
VAKTEVATISSRFPALASASDAMAAIRENLQGERLTERDLDQVRIPAGDATTWKLPTLEGDPESLKTIEGIVVMHRLTRVYWKRSFEDSEGGPPDCYSPDSEHGIGDPGIACDVCPNAEFGSDPKGGKGQACQQRRQFFVLRDGLLPIVITLPATSLKPSRDYLMRLTSRGVKVTDVITRFELERRNDGGPNGNIAYAVAKLSLVERLDPAGIVAAEDYARTVRPIFDRMPIPTDG